jgi:hypothetical protein
MTGPLRFAFAVSFFIAAAAIANADVYKTGDSFVGFAASDQHGAAFSFKAGDARFILLDTPGESGTSPQMQDPDWLSKHRALLVVNISDLSFMKRRVARSRMKSKPFRMLVVDEPDVAKKFPREDGKFSVLLLDEKGTVTAVKFANPGKELQDLIAGQST